MPSKLKIKVGLIEVDYEGEEKFLKEEFPQLLLAVTKLHKELGNTITPPQVAPSEKGKAPITDLGQASTSTIAQKIGGGSGPELVLAASTYLTLVLNKDSFTRKEITEEIKKAKAFFKANYVSNLSTILKRLCANGKLNELGSEVYSLNESAKTALTTQLNA